MGRIYDADEVKAGYWWVESRRESIIISTSNDTIEIGYEEFDDFQKAVKFAQKVRRDKP